VLLIALWLAGALASNAAAGAAPLDGRLDPIGTWNCVVYGHPALGDERMLFAFAPHGRARVARQDSTGETSKWTPLSPWHVRDDELEFSDPRTGRQFHATLDQSTLGGGWRTPSLIGGWWCSVANVPAPEDSDIAAPATPPLVPSLTATPSYPLQAIRTAKQGRAVVCFLVDWQGFVAQSEIIELSDEIFRAPTLAAIARSRYEGWDDESALRPGCRSYIFKLDERNADDAGE
jgi:hypothetical protein